MTIEGALSLDAAVQAGAAWFAWEPITPGECMTLAALALAAWGLWQMRAASTVRNRQVDAQTRLLDNRTAALTRGLEALIRGMETTILQATPARAADSAPSPAFTRGEGPHDRP